MIATDQHGQNWRKFLTLKIFVEMTKSLVFFRTMHIIQILLMSQRLEIATDEKQVKVGIDLLLKSCDLAINFLQFSVETALDGHLYKRVITFMNI